MTPRQRVAELDRLIAIRRAYQSGDASSTEVCNTLRNVDLDWLRSAALRTAPEGMVVPEEPTVEMILAASSEHRLWIDGSWDNRDGSNGYWQSIYRAMLSAAPSALPPEQTNPNPAPEQKVALAAPEVATGTAPVAGPAQPADVREKG